MDTKPRVLEEIAFEEAAQAYLRSLPPEHFMESVAQATQRKITVASLELVHLERPDIQTFSELLVQYRLPKQRPIRQVVPDNMVVVHDTPIQASGSFALPLQPCGPYWMLEYVSKINRRKDYEDNLQKYERELKVPYYLLFVPDVQELTLYHLHGKKFKSVPPDENHRHALPELELEVGLLDGWVRFWFRGRLLPLPADLQRELEATRKELTRERRRANREAQRADSEAQRANSEAQRADSEAQRADSEAQRADSETQRAAELAQRADSEAQRAAELAQRADSEAQRAAELAQQLEAERLIRLAADQELAHLRALVEQAQTRPRHHS